MPARAPRLTFLRRFAIILTMTDIFYAPRLGASRDFTARVLGEYYGFENVIFSRSAAGKPCCNQPIFFSLSHTKEFFFLAVSQKETGIDAESLSRRGDFSAIISRLPAPERARALASPEEFLKIYTQREAIAKYLAKPVFSLLPKISALPCDGGDFVGENHNENDGFGDSCKVFLSGEPLHAIVRTFCLAGHALSVCLAAGETPGKIKAIF